MNPELNSAYTFKKTPLQRQKQMEYSKEIVEYNEKQLQIHEKIRKIPQYFLFFSPIHRTEKLNLSSTHLVIYRENLIPFNKFFQHLSQREKLGYIISSFKHLLQATKLLSVNGIYTIRYQHIGFQKNGIPLIYDFQSCADLTYLPLELHILMYLSKNKMTALSDDNLQHIIRNFYKCNGKQVSYKDVQECLHSGDFHKWVNKPTEDVKKHVVALNTKWYVYGLGHLYTNLIADLDMQDIPDELIKIIMTCKTIQLNQRPSIEEVIASIDGLFY